MKVEKDYADLLRLFNKHKVRYLIVGAYAVAFYARPRYTKDLDILVDPQEENAQRILKALDEFGFGSLKLSVQDFAKPGRIIQLGYEPIRIDLLTSMKGLSFNHAWEGRVAGRYGSQRSYFIGRNDLMRAKRSTGRPQDQVDSHTLGAFKRARKR